MYKVAYETCVASRRPVSTADPSMVSTAGGRARRGSTDKSLRTEAACICNYATFMFRQRGNIKRAKELFVDGIRR
jgi:hypothetical protein